MGWSWIRGAPLPVSLSPKNIKKKTAWGKNMTIRGGMSWRYFVILNEMILTLMRERERERERGNWRRDELEVFCYS